MRVKIWLEKPEVDWLRKHKLFLKVVDRHWRYFQHAKSYHHNTSPDFDFYFPRISKLRERIGLLRKVLRKMVPFKGCVAYEMQLFSLVIQWKLSGTWSTGYWSQNTVLERGKLTIWRDTMWNR